jgi:hypothetical protein
LGKDLFLILKSEYYWSIFRKEKSIEYRIASKRNESLIKNQKFVIFQLGYSSENKMRLRIVKIEKENNEFKIHLDLSEIFVISLVEKNKNQLSLFK